MDIWEKLFGAIGFWVIPLIILTWVGREIVQYRLKNKQTKISATLELRAGEIQSLHRHLRKTESLLTDLYYLYMPVGMDPPKVDPVNVLRRVRELKSLAETQRIFYSNEIVGLIDSMCNSLSRVACILVFTCVNSFAHLKWKCLETKRLTSKFK